MHLLLLDVRLGGRLKRPARLLGLERKISRRLWSLE
jgi:hypothetical protein